MEKSTEKPKFSLAQKASVFAPAALGLTGVEMFLHAPPPLEVAFLAGAFFLASKSSEIYANLREHLPELPERAVHDPSKTDWSFTDRLMGKHLQGPYRAEGYAEEDLQAADPETEKLTLDTPEGIVLAPDLIIPASEIAGKAIFIAGIRRSGKTTLGVRLAEQMSKYDLPLFVPDLEGDWLSAAATTFKHGRILAHPSATRRYTDVPDFEAVTLADADVAGFNILDDGVQAVLDMASYPSVDEACAVVVKIIQGLFDWTEQYEDDRVPCQIMLDEAQRFLPQSLDDSIIQDKLVRNALLKAYMDIIAVGGKRGLSPMILSQRFSQVNKKIMAQSEIFFLLRQTMDNDLKRCMEYVSSKIASEEAISMFVPGQGVYIAATGEQLVTRFTPRTSDGKRGATPTIEAAARYSMPRPSHSQYIPTMPVFQAENASTIPAIGEGVNELLEPVNALRTSVNIREQFTPSQVSENANVKVTGAVKEQILKAIIAMQKEGKNLTRTGLRDFLKWNNRQYEELLKPALDEMGILN